MTILSTSAALLLGLNVVSGSIPEGRSTHQVATSRGPIETFLYLPEGKLPSKVIVVMHGTLRNALTYREDAIAMAERFHALLIVPKFDSDRFPSRLYQRGGILNADGTAAEKSKMTYPVVREVIDAVRKQANLTVPFWMIGHSAGGQFLVRMAAFGPIGAERIVASNAGSHVFPTRDMPFGYGFGGLPEAIANEDAIRAYLAAPLTLYQGTADNGPDEYFDQSADAMKQGPGRFQRARASFDYARKLAELNNWKFNWRWVVAQNIGHDHEKMFNHPSCERALFGKRLHEGQDWP